MNHLQESTRSSSGNEVQSASSVDVQLEPSFLGCGVVAAPSSDQLRTLAARLQSIREEERSRIAREVHDVLGQALTGIKMDATWIATHLPDTHAKVAARARLMSDLIDSTIQIVRRIATDLRPGILDNLGLAAAVEWQAGEFQTRTGINCRVTTTLGDLTIAIDSATAV